VLDDEDLVLVRVLHFDRLTVPRFRWRSHGTKHCPLLVSGVSRERPATFLLDGNASDTRTQRARLPGRNDGHRTTRTIDPVASGSGGHLQTDVSAHNHRWPPPLEDVAHA
jgi:hypothetical protein